MLPPPTPSNESARLAVLRDYRLMEQSPDHAIDELTDLAAKICHTPIALVTLVEEDRQWFYSRHGIDVQETPRDISMCAHAILEEHLLIVPDTTRDARFQANPLVTGPPAVRFYAGVVLRTPDGHAIGTLCVIDLHPRELSAEHCQMLQTLSRQVMAQLELRRQTRLAADHGRFLQGILDSDTMGVTLFSLGRRILRANPTALRIMEAESIEEVIGQRADSLIHPDSREPYNAFLDSLTSGQPGRVEYQITGLQGTAKWLQTHASPQRDESGRTIGILGLTRDITRARELEVAVRESEERFHTLVDSAIEGILLFIEDEPAYVNPALCRLLGYSADEILNMSSEARLDLVHPDDRETARALRRGLGTTISQTPWEMRIRHRDGSLRWVRTGGSAFTLHGRNAQLKLYIDVTEQKEAELRLQQLNRTHTMLSKINQLIVREPQEDTVLAESCRIAHHDGGFLLAWIGQLQPDGILRIVAHAGADSGTLTMLEQLYSRGPAACEFTRRSLASGHREICQDVTTHPDAELWRREALDRGYLSIISLPLKVDGNVIGNFNLYAPTTHFFNDEEVSLLDKLALDIGYAVQMCRREKARARAEAERHASQERFRLLAENIHEVFWITDPDKHQTIYVSPAYESIWGRTCQSLYDHPEEWINFIHPDDRHRISSSIRNHHQTKGTYDESYRIVRPDGTVRWIRDRAYPVKKADGTIDRIVGTAIDITEQRQLEEQLRESQKMEAIGQLAGGIAHDFNNILSAIMMQAGLIARHTDLTPRGEKLVADLRSSAQRAADLIRQVLAFSRRQVMQTQRLDLNHNIRQVAQMLQRLVREDVQVKLDLHPTPLPIMADSAMIDQVLLNLAINARDAMPTGGEMTITSSPREISAPSPSAATPTDLPPGPYACLRVTDTGCGIPADVLPRIYEPFFTTKEHGAGTGLGLATVYGAVRQHKGRIEVTSETGVGSSFEVLIPLTRAEDSTPPMPVPTTRRGAGETILLVEDNDAVRKTTKTLLREFGFNVTAAANGPAAEALWDQAPAPFDLLFTDVIMPGGCDGTELAQNLRARHPRLRVVFTSGYDGGRLTETISGQPHTHFLPKPADAEQILTIIRQSLDAPANPVTDQA